MKQIYKIKLDILDMPEFLDITNEIVNDINLSQGKAVVSAKSLMGIYSLDLSNPINLIIRDVTENDNHIVEKFEKWFVEDENNIEKSDYCNKFWKDSFF